MPSTVAWLDASSSEQQRMQEIVALFAMSDSRDELGLGQVRDAVSDALFPGTSTLHTRARYALLIPWCFERATRTSRPEARLPGIEKELITTLRRASGDTDGLLGRTAGTALRTLPSVTYWGLLRRWGIVVGATSRSDALASAAHRPDSDDDFGETHVRRIWTTPPAPSDFPASIDGFDLEPEEASWLRERVLASSPGSLLAHFAQVRPASDSSSPWDDPGAVAAPPRAARLLELAQGFSVVMHGAQLLYNLLLAQACAARDVGPQEHGSGVSLVEHYRGRVAAWGERATSPVATSWSLAPLLDTLADASDVRLAVAPALRRFVDDWSATVRTTDPTRIADSTEARAIVAARERAKGAKARLDSAARLAAWSGAAGSEAMAFRWRTVRRMLLDIHEGLDLA